MARRTRPSWARSTATRPGPPARRWRSPPRFRCGRAARPRASASSSIPRTSAAPGRSTMSMSTPTDARKLDDSAGDVRAAAASERLLEDSWETRSRRVSGRELIAEGLAGLLFLACAVPLAVTAVGGHGVDPRLAALLVVLYALVS